MAREDGDRQPSCWEGTALGFQGEICHPLTAVLQNWVVFSLDAPKFLRIC